MLETDDPNSNIIANIGDKPPPQQLEVIRQRNADLLESLGVLTRDNGELFLATVESLERYAKHRSDMGLTNKIHK